MIRGGEEQGNGSDIWLGRVRRMGNRAMNAPVSPLAELVPGTAPYPRNAWYVAATAAELGREPLHRWLLGKPVLLYRQEDGHPAALFDRCPHRGYPLSAGKIVGDAVECGYHGLRFAADGRCILIPSGGAMPQGLGVASYPVVERWQWVWIWMGDPALADPGLIPDLAGFGLGQPDWHSETSVTLAINANYLLSFENFLDASHITFLHTGQIDSGDVAGEPLEMQVDGGRIVVARRIVDELQSPLTMRTFGFEGDRAHRTITAEALPPSLCGIRVEVEPVVQSATARQVNQLVVGITPQDDTRTLQFTAVTQTFPFFNPGRHDDLRNLLMEDVVAMEKIQALHDALPPQERVEYGLLADKGAYQARRMLAAMLRNERGAAAMKG